MTRPLGALATFLVLATVGAAQGPYLVDGQLGADAPGHGGPGQTPWRTIGYALAHATPPPGGPALVRIQGGQTYAAGTNGESYPLLVPPTVVLEGVLAGSGQPELRPPLGVDALQLFAGSTYADSHALCRRLFVTGGDIALLAGALPGSAHRILLEDCTFQMQAIAGIRLLGQGGVDELTVRRCDFLGPGAGSGVHFVLTGGLTAQAVELEQCRLDLLGAGVFSEGYGFGIHQSTQSLVMRGCQLTNCGFGVHSDAPWNGGQENVTSTVLIERTRIANCATGIRLGTGPAASSQHTGIVRDSAIVQCMTGSDLVSGGNLSFGGVASLVLERVAVVQCSTAVRSVNNSGCAQTLLVRDGTLLQNGIGVSLFGGRLGNHTATITGTRMLDGGNGLVAWLDCYSSWTTIRSSIVARHAGNAIQFDGSPNGGNHLGVHHATLADNGSALVVTAAGNQSRCDHTVFSGNATDLALSVPVPVAQSVSDTSVLPGASNLPPQNLLLFRPTLKLLPGSPCLDAGLPGPSTPLADFEGDPRVLPASPGAAALPDLGADEYVFAGSLRPYGTAGCNEQGVSPRIGSTSPGAPVGGSYQIELTGGSAPLQAAPSVAFLATGLRDFPEPLPFDLAVWGLAGSYLLLDPQEVQAAIPVSAAGAAAFTQAIPNLAFLVGLPLHHQWLVAMPPPYGLVTSDALRVTLGQ